MTILSRAERPSAHDLSPASIAQLQSSLHGRLIQPDDADYDAARRVFNGLIDKHPALIACCQDVADVVTAIKFARDHDLLLSVRGGGHNAAGLGMCDDGLVIDLSLLRSIQVDPTTATVRVGGGATWADVDAATHPFGLTVPCGIIAGTGVGGLTLGGGHGYLTRQYGLTIDNLLAAEVVLADGAPVTASADENADLFWALRGGGGNFGVVTSFLFQARPVHTVYAGPMIWPFTATREIMQWFQEFIAAAPPEVYGWLGTLTVPPGPPFPPQWQMQQACAVVWCINLPADEAEAILQPVRKRMQPALDFVGPLPMPAVNSMFDTLYPTGLHWYWRGDFFHKLGDKAIDLHVKYSAQAPTPLSAMHLYPVDGRAAEIEPSATAWNYRGARFSQVIVGISPDPQEIPQITQWAKDYWLALHPYGAGGSYVNFLMEEGQERVQATYGANYARLRQIKARYDPGNLLRVNQNITPAKE